jgi:hypothetical protein
LGSRWVRLRRFLRAEFQRLPLPISTTVQCLTGEARVADRYLGRSTPSLRWDWTVRRLGWEILPFGCFSRLLRVWVSACLFLSLLGAVAFRIWPSWFPLCWVVGELGWGGFSVPSFNGFLFPSFSHSLCCVSRPFISWWAANSSRQSGSLFAIVATPPSIRSLSFLVGIFLVIQVVFDVYVFSHRFHVSGYVLVLVPICF